MGDRPTLIQSVQRALRLLEVVAERDGRARAKEVARADRSPPPHDLPPAAHLHPRGLAAAAGRRVLRARPPHRRRPRQGTAARGVAHARPALEWLRDELGSAVYLARYVDGEVVVVEIVDSARAPRIDLWVGMHDAAHATALGKCILGQLRAADREDYLSRHPLHDLTPRTVVDRRRLRLPAAGRRRRRRRGVRRRGLLPRRAGRPPAGAGAVGVVTAPRRASAGPRPAGRWRWAPGGCRARSPSVPADRADLAAI